MIKTDVRKGDRVVMVRGEGRNLRDPQGQPVVCSVLTVNRQTGRVVLEVPRPKTKHGERDKPQRGVELWKTVRYNPKSGEAGGLKVIKRPVHVSTLKIVQKGPHREFGPAQ